MDEVGKVLFILGNCKAKAHKRNSVKTDRSVNSPARWKPAPDSWSILEVVNHLYDEEREDFRVRLDTILYHPGRPWPPINSTGWVTERAYNQRDLSHYAEAFLKERRKSLAWLRGLETPDWQASVTAPFGQISAGDMFAASSSCTGLIRSTPRNRTRSITPGTGKACIKIVYASYSPAWLCS